MTIAVVLAGGSGRRMGDGEASVPKQFLPLAGRPMIEYPIDTFCNHPMVDEVAVVVNRKWRGEMEAIAARRAWPKLKRIIDGGDERYMSSLAAIMAYIDYPDDTVLMLHDAARPLLPPEVIDRVVTAMGSADAVGVAIGTTDTVWEVRPDIEQGARFVARVPERRLMWSAQTPQAFRLPLLRDAYQRALQDSRFAATDDCGVVWRYMPGTKIWVVEGDSRNFKITIASDLQRAELMVNA